MVTMTLPPKRSKVGIEAQIENLEYRLQIQKQWVRNTERELKELREQLK